MALLNKLFSSRKKCTKQPSKSNELFESSCWEAPIFSKDQIRVLVFRECEWRGRKLLFDWKSVKKVTDSSSKRNGCDASSRRSCPLPKVCPEKNDGYTEVTQNGISYQYLRPRSDVKMLGEMMFGSVEMSYKGETMKIHTIRSPSRIMISKVMPAPTHCTERSDLDGSGSLQNSISDCINLRIPVSKENGCSIAQSVPVDVPAALFSRTIPSEDELELFAPSSLRSNSSFSSIHSSYQRSPEGSLNGSLNNLTRSGSFNGLQRRWHRTLNTSMEFGLRRRSDECGMNGAKEEKQVSNHRRTKLGISVVITLSDDEEQEKHFQSFFFSHIALIETYVAKLSMAVEKAYVNRKLFVHLVFEGVEFLQQSLCDLYTAPRFPRPVWLSLMARGAQHRGLCLHFVKEFMSLVESYDTKTTNFFVSTLLTAVLMHHLSWVPTVTPPETDILPRNSYHDKHTVKWLDVLAKSHPYNPLWVQLGDLYGALGFPSKISRTVIVGSDGELVRRVIYCLTYFIRCSEVFENVESRSVAPFPSRQNVMSASSTSSGSTLLGDSVQLPSFSNATCHDLSSLRVESSVNNGRTLDRRQSELELLTTKGSKSLAGTTRSMTSVDVVRQEGEGDDEDEEEDEVFHDQPSSEFQEAPLRVKTPSCEKCETGKKLHRCGVIYGGGGGGGSEVPMVPNFMSSTGTDFRKEDVGCLRTSSVTRDSGVHSFMEIDEVKKGLPADSCVLSDSEGNKTKRKEVNGKVMFSIGNIPLEEICCKSERESSPAKDVLVCTCGKHVSVTGSKVGAIFTKVDQTLDSNGHILHSVNKRLVQLNCFEMQQPASNLSDSSLNVNSCLSSIPSSLAYDSGIHSCEDSSVDLASSKASITEIRALNVSIPDAKREHVRNVGKSRECGMSNGESTDYIGLPGNCSISHAYPIGDPSSKSLSNAVHCKWRTRFDYERTNSMFDEYFDENIELNMLDDESFQETLKSHRAKANAAAVNRKQTDVPQSGEHKCQCQGSKCDSRDSLLDGQDGASSLCKTCEEEEESTTRGPPASSAYQSTSSKRHVLWNTALDTFEGSSDGELEFFKTAIELDMPKSEINEAPRNTSEYVQGFSRSLLSNYVDHYLSDFALQGTSERAFGTRLMGDLKVAVQNPILDEPVAEAICIVSNIENWTVELVSSKNGVVTDSGFPIGVRVSTSQLVAGMTESLLHLWKMKMSPEFCLMHLEDRLQEFYFKSRLLAEYLLEVQPLGVQSVTSALGVDASDLPLLLAIASTHSPEVTCTYGLGYR